MRGWRSCSRARPGIDVVGEAASGEDCIRQTGELHPDVVLLDVVMPGRSGIEVLPEILAASEPAKVLVLSMQDDPAYVREAFAEARTGTC